MVFRYLSFQRAPPSRLIIGGESTISIAPSISNDLRDESYELNGRQQQKGQLDIQVAWILTASSQLRSTSTGHEQPIRLVKKEESIAWHGSHSAWKNIELTTPSKETLQQAGCTTGDQSWELRLAMWIQQDYGRPTDTQRRVMPLSKKLKTQHLLALAKPPSQASFGKHLLIDPAQATTASSAGKTVFLPVSTPPIELIDPKAASSSTTSAPKFAEVSRLWRTESRRGEADTVRDLDDWVEIREENGFELDRHVWDASIPLMTYLGDPDKDDALLPRKDVTVLELGAGTGLLSIWLQRQVAAIDKEEVHLLEKSNSDQQDKELDEQTQEQQQATSRSKVKFILTDVDSAVPLMNKNIAINHTTEDDGLQIDVLDWFDTSKLSNLLLPNDELDTSPRDILVLASDCFYNPSSYEAFASVLKGAFELGAHRRVGRIRCLLSKKHRHEEEKTFKSFLQNVGLSLKLAQGQDDGPIGDVTGDEDTDIIGTWGIYEVLYNAKQ